MLTRFYPVQWLTLSILPFFCYPTNAEDFWVHVFCFILYILIYKYLFDSWNMFKQNKAQYIYTVFLYINYVGRHRHETWTYPKDFSRYYLVVLLIRCWPDLLFINKDLSRPFYPPLLCLLYFHFYFYFSSKERRSVTSERFLFSCPCASVWVKEPGTHNSQDLKRKVLTPLEIV